MTLVFSVMSKCGVLVCPVCVFYIILVLFCSVVSVSYCTCCFLFKMLKNLEVIGMFDITMNMYRYDLNKKIYKKKRRNLCVHLRGFKLTLASL